jgi:hypothetical protein
VISAPLQRNRPAEDAAAAAQADRQLDLFGKGARKGRTIARTGVPVFVGVAAARCRKKWSERRDLNSGPPVPQTGALTGLRYAPPGQVACSVGQVAPGRAILHAYCRSSGRCRTLNPTGGGRAQAAKENPGHRYAAGTPGRPQHKFPGGAHSDLLPKRRASRSLCDGMRQSSTILTSALRART